MFGINFESQTNTLGVAVVVALIDKGIFAIILLFASYVVNRKLEQFKASMNKENALEASRASLANELRKLKTHTQIQFLERQLSEFFWPVLLRFDKDSSIWRRIPNLSVADNILPETIGGNIERSYLLPNHQEAVRIIESKIHLVQDVELVTLLQQYIKHVAVYSALRAADSNLNPIDLGEPFPEKLPQKLQRKTMALQSRYNNLVKSELIT